MRKLFVVWAFVFAVAAPAKAQNWANKVFGGNPNAPVLHDFGTVARGAQLQTTLTMTNIYKVPLDITDIRVSCGCVTATPSTKQLPPNGQATLDIKMDGTRWPGGPKSVNVYVTFGPQFVSTANLVISANARADVVLNPGEIDFGSVQRGQPVERSLEVEYAGTKPWTINQVVKSPTAPFDLKAEKLPPRVANNAPVIGYRLIATLKPDAQVGTFRETVDLKTNDAQQPVVSFLVTGTISAPVSVAPNPVQPAGLKLGNVSNTKVVVTANQPFRITGVQGTGDDVNLIIPDRPASPIHVLDIQVTPKAPGLLNREIILQTDMRNEKVRVVIQGNVTP